MPEAANVCSTPGCGKVAAMQCPKCLEYSLPPTHFCSQECFKGYWKTHNATHAEARARLNFRPPAFAYTGELRPHYVTPRRAVPDHIAKPDHAVGGLPLAEMKDRTRSKIHINSPEEIKGIRASCILGREILDMAAGMVRPGITPEEIDKAVHDMTIARGAYPSPLNYYHFPKSCCISVNEVICHGIPDARPLQEGDIVNIDISVYLKGFHADLNETFTVGKVDEASKKLIKAAHDSMMLAIEAVKPGVLARDFGDIISRHVHKLGYSVVRSYCGHGTGVLFHAPPDIPHYARNKAVGVLKPGMVFTIEPMINMGRWEDVTWPDEWTVVTRDGKRSAQFEHTVLVTDTGVEILTARTKHSPPLCWEVQDDSASTSGSGKSEAESKA